MAALGSFAAIISLISFIIAIALVIAFFIMTSNVSDIAKRLHKAGYTQAEIKNNLDRIVKLMEQQEKAKA